MILEPEGGMPDGSDKSPKQIIDGRCSAFAGRLLRYIEICQI